MKRPFYYSCRTGPDRPGRCGGLHADVHWWRGGDTLSGTVRTATIVQAATVALIALAGAACGQPEPASEPAGPRAFFVQPADGATVQSPVALEFGAEEFQIAAVPAGTVTATRPDLGHFHVAIDADCLSTGEVIPSAAPWVHFGDGSNIIDMQLPPGPHGLTLQIGDDLHRTIEGLCSTISVDVTE